MKLSQLSILCMPKLVSGYTAHEIGADYNMEDVLELAELGYLEKIESGKDFERIRSPFYKIRPLGVKVLFDTLIEFEYPEDEKRFSAMSFYQDNEEFGIFDQEESFLSKEVLEKIDEFNIHMETSSIEDYLNSLGDGIYSVELMLNENVLSLYGKENVIFIVRLSV